MVPLPKNGLHNDYVILTWPLFQEVQKVVLSTSKMDPFINKTHLEKF